MSSAPVPSSVKEFRDLRACKYCSLLKTLDQFENNGCDNCDSFLRLKNNRDRAYECTSANFDGLIALMDPADSWVSKWQRIDNMARGIYAISVSGELPDSIKRELDNKGVPVRSRDVAQKN